MGWAGATAEKAGTSGAGQTNDLTITVFIPIQALEFPQYSGIATFFVQECMIIQVFISAIEP